MYRLKIIFRSNGNRHTNVTVRIPLQARSDCPNLVNSTNRYLSVVSSRKKKKEVRMPFYSV